MKFQERLRKDLIKLSIRLIIIICIIFTILILILNQINNNININNSITPISNEFINFNNNIYQHLSILNDKYVKDDLTNLSNSDTILALQIDNYNFSKVINVNYSLNIYDLNNNLLYGEKSISNNLLTEYLNIIKNRVFFDEVKSGFISYNSDDSLVIFYAPIISNNQTIAIACIYIDVNEISYGLLPNNGYYILTDNYDNIIASTTKELYNKFQIFYNNSDNLLINNNEYIVYKNDYKYFKLYYFKEKINYTNTYLFFTIIIIGFVGLTIYISTKIINKFAFENTKSINQIILDTNIISSGNTNHHISENLDYEFAELSKYINVMIDKLNNEIALNNQLHQENLVFEKKKLSAQFNPHLLFNSLETIRYSMKYDIEGAEKYILLLNDILRYSINNKIDAVNLKDDFIYIKKYLDLYQYRYGKKFCYTINIPKEMENLIIPKLAIQPLVANCIKYAFADKLTSSIIINCYQKDNFNYIEVIDDGKAIPKEILTSINKLVNSSQNSSNHIGVHSVARSFKLLYPNSSLAITLKENQNVVTIKFQGEKNV